MTRVAIVVMLMAAWACGDDASGETDCQALAARPEAPADVTCIYVDGEGAEVDCGPVLTAPDGMYGCILVGPDIDGCEWRTCDEVR